jgi:hypothetical protein
MDDETLAEQLTAIAVALQQWEADSSSIYFTFILAKYMMRAGCYYTKLIKHSLTVA